MTAGQFILIVFDECDDRFVAADIPFDLFLLFIFREECGYARMPQSVLRAF